MLTDRERQEIESELHDYPYKHNACISALKIVQRHRGGWVPDEGIRDIADFLEMSPDEVDSVATFYNLIMRQPVGKHKIFISSQLPREIEPLFIIDSYALFYLGLLLLTGLGVTVLAYSYLVRRSGAPEELYLLLLIATLGSATLVTAAILSPSSWGWKPSPWPSTP